MATYVGPEQWNKATKESAERRAIIKKAIDDDSYSLGPGWDTLEVRRAARNAVTNIKESEIEDLDQRIADQYPAGTTYAGRKSRNRAGYGKPVVLPKDE